jgi:4-hydroxy-tetrahydrodipicolinate synthase
MPRFPDFEPHGVIPATLLAFNEDLSIDEEATRRHLREVGRTPGISALTVNGHASELQSCTLDEQKRLLAIAQEEIGDDVPLICGVYADGSLEAARIARQAEEGGASALLIFPPASMIFGGQLRPEMAVLHYRHIADATDLPLIVFQYPIPSGLGYPFETLLKMIDAVPTIRAVKDFCGDPMLHERTTRELQSLPNPVNVITTHSAWLMASLTMGANGLLSGAGSVICDLQVELWDAVQKDDLTRARALNDRIYPLAQAFYSPPGLDMHNRMKECLVMLGRMPRATVRPPLAKLTDAEIARLRTALVASGLLEDAGDGTTRPAEVAPAAA